MAHKWEVPVAELETFLLSRARKIHRMYPGVSTEEAAQMIALEAEMLAAGPNSLLEQWRVWPAADFRSFYARSLTARPPIVLMARTVLELREKVLAHRAGTTGPRGAAISGDHIQARKAG